MRKKLQLVIIVKYDICLDYVYILNAQKGHLCKRYIIREYLDSNTLIKKCVDLRKIYRKLMM